MTLNVQTIPYTFPGQIANPDTGTPGVEVSEGSRDMPVIVLVHGTGGDVRDMTDPANAPVAGVNYDYDGPLPPTITVGWSTYPGVGVWSCCSLDAKKPVMSWRDVLNANGFATAAYSQFDGGDGFLAPPGTPPPLGPVDELVSVMRALRGFFGEETRFVLLAHSRGGLLVRKFLRDHEALARSVDTVITLHSPHTGSELATTADAVASAVASLETQIGTLATDALGWLLTIAQSDAYQEMAVGSPFLTALAAGEQALPWANYFTFGGVSVRLTRILSWVYTLDSALPQWHWPPFLHRRMMAEVPGVSPVANTLPPTIDELTEGRGDLLTADLRDRLPFAMHQTNPINHGEALWHPTIQAQVLNILGVKVPVPPAGGVTSFWW